MMGFIGLRREGAAVNTVGQFHLVEVGKRLMRQVLKAPRKDSSASSKFRKARGFVHGN
jgi:hypothetical protein